MEKVIRNKKAGVAPLAIIIVIVLVIAGITLYVSTARSDPYWETENEFGIWQDELMVEFADGTTESLKIINEGKERSFAVTYDGKDITRMFIKLTAKVSGEGYDGADLKMAGFGYTGKILKGSVTKYTWAGSVSDSTIQISLGSTEVITESGLNLKTVMDDDPSEYPDGSYTISFIPKGTVQYRGYPDGGDWESASLPPSRSATVTVAREASGTITVTLGSEITTQ